MALVTLPERIHHFLSWQARSYAQMDREEAALQPGPFVTISREYGCEGYPLANHLAERLNAIRAEPVPWLVMDRTVMEAVTQRKGAGAEFVEALSERRRGRIQQTVEVLLSHKPIEYQAYEMLAECFLSLAEAGRVILVGRGGAIVCAGLPRGVHVRLVAPLAWRARKIARERGVSLQEAEGIASKEGHKRDAFVREFTGKTYADPALYDFVFNNARCPVEEVAELVVAALRRRGLA